MQTIPRFSRIKRLGLLLLITLLLSGCAQRLSCSGIAAVDFLGTTTDLNHLAYRIADDLLLSAQPPLYPHNSNLPILVTTFVDNNDLSRTNSFGRTLQTAISSRFVQQGYAVQEILLGDTFFLEPREGLTVLTRDLNRLALNANTQAVVVGTWSRTGRTLYLNARLVNPGNSAIIASKDYRLCMDDDVLEMFNLTVKEDSNEITPPSQGLLNTIFPFITI